jgi:soluble P-type ATPase
MGLTYEIPGSKPISVEHLLLDVNGTLTDRGELIDGVAERLQRLSEELSVALLSADTLGTLDTVAEKLGVEAIRVNRGDEKRDLVRNRGPSQCAAIGNGANDATMLATAALGIVVIGPEGAAARAVHAADVVCRSIGDALDLLLDPRAVASTLRL